MSTTLKIANGDVIINAANGRPAVTADANKLRQDLTEFFTVAVQPNGFGAGLEQLIGVVEESSDVFVSLADRQIRQGIDVFTILQGQDSRIDRPTGERLVGLTYLAVERDPTDPTKFWFRANLVTENGIEVPLLIPQST